MGIYVVGVKMSSSSICMKCQSEFAALRIAMYWPTKIPCKSCTTQHLYRFGHFIGVLYVLLLFLAVLIPISYSENFVHVENGIYSTSGVQLAVKFGGIFLAYLIVGFLYGKIMKKHFILRARNP